MSRRRRLEAERAKHMSDDLHMEEDKLKKQKERIFAPLVWRELENSIKIQDMKPVHHEEVIKLTEDYHINVEVVARNANIADHPVSKASFLAHVQYNLRNRSSVIAIDQGNEGEIAGFLILKVVRKVDFGRVFSRTRMVEGEPYTKYRALINVLERKVDIFELFDCDIFLKYCLLCIKPSYRKKGLGLALMQCATQVARTLNIRVIMGIFSNFKMQDRAKEVGMDVIYEIYYAEWTDHYNELIFDEPGVGNYTCALMAGKLPSPGT